MTEEITRDKFPSNGGWKFRQPQFGPNWNNTMAMVGFDASVKYIMAARNQNKALSAKHGLSTDYETIADELIKYNRLIRGIPLPAPPSFFHQSRSQLFGENAAANIKLFRQIRRVGTGVATLADWLGTDGKPVDTALAEQRASICCGTDEATKCPQNKEGDLLSFFTKPVSNLILKQLEERKSLNLSTSHDSKLGVCYACGCPLKLKVHVPVSFIKSHIGKEELNNLDARCWILKEQ